MKDLDKLIDREFPVIKSLIHMNHAAVGPWPTSTSDAVIRFAQENNRTGSTRFGLWLKTEQELRDLSASLVGASSADDIALVKNTSEGLSMVAHGMPWQHGDNVVISDEEFPSNRIVWESLSDKGVEVRMVALPCSDNVEDRLLDACDQHTRVLSISSVEYASGMRVDLSRLGSACRKNGIAFCVDAIQGLGVFPHNVERDNIDFLVADGHKWLLGPEGLAVFYCSPKWRERLTLHEFGWRMVEDLYEFTQPEWQPAASARRFECGSQNMVGVTALKESVALLLAIGIDEIWKRVRERTELLFDLIESNSQLELITCSAQGRYAGITVFKHRQLTDKQLYERLTGQNVLCAMRGGGVRFSPHFYVPVEQIEQAVYIAAG